MDELAQKVYQPAGNVTPRPWFSSEQLETSAELIKAAEVRAEEIAAEEAEREKAAEVKAEEDVLYTKRVNLPLGFFWAPSSTGSPEGGSFSQATRMTFGKSLTAVSTKSHCLPLRAASGSILWETKKCK